jgi:predicted nucleic acid-binding protein
MRLYLDANVIVYLIEGPSGLRNAVLAWIDQAEAAPEGLLLTSYLSTLECRVKPLRDAEESRLALFDGFFERDTLLVADVTRAVLDQAAALRARFGFKTPDAIHLATAVIHGASAFLTADRAFERFQELRVVVVDPGGG